MNFSIFSMGLMLSMLMNPIVIGIPQIIPAIILIAYGWVKQKKYRVYFDMLLMTLPAALFYWIFMRNLPEGLFHSYFYLFVKVILFVLPGFVIIKLRKYKSSDFGITRTNTPTELKHLVIRQADNLFLFHLTEQQDLQHISPAARIDSETVSMIAKALPLYRCLAVGETTRHYPFVIDVKHLPVQTAGKTRLFFTEH